MLGFFQIFGLWGPRAWKIADPKARDAIGVGAFNLIRRTAYEQVGGFEALRMEIVEDLGLGRRVKRAGLLAAAGVWAGAGAGALGSGSDGAGAGDDEESVLGVRVLCVAGADGVWMADGVLA